MDELEKRANTEKFLETLIKEWKRLFACQSSGVGTYRFDRGRWMDLKEVLKLINTLKEDNKIMRKTHMEEMNKLRDETRKLKIK